MIDTEVLRPDSAGPKPPRGRLRLFLGLTLALSLVALGLFLSRGADEAGVEELRRNVQAGKDGGSFVSVQEHSSVRVGDSVRTDTTGRGQVDYPDGSMTRLGPDTIFAIEELRSGAERVTQGRLDLGRSLHRVEKLVSSEDRFQVSTQNAVATVQGTVFFIECHVDRVQRDPTAPGFPLAPQACDSETLAVSEGRVMWYSGAQELTLGPEECRTKPGKRQGAFGPCKYTDDQLRAIFASLGADDTFPASNQSQADEGTDDPNQSRPGVLAQGPADQTPGGPPASSDPPGNPSPNDKKKDPEDKSGRDTDPPPANPGEPSQPPDPGEPSQPPDPGEPGGNPEPGDGDGDESSDDAKCVDKGQEKCKGKQVGGGPSDDKGKDKDKDKEDGDPKP